MKIKITGIFIFFCSILIGVSPSCKKDFLDKNPLDALSSQTFWKSDIDVQQALTGVYSKLQKGFYSDSKVFLDAYSDNAYDRFSYFGFDNATMGIMNSSSVSGANFYNTPYSGIAACNFFLDNVGKAPIAASALAGYTAEVRFLRAMYYFDLVQAFGGVVLYKTEPTSISSSKIAQSGKDDVLTFVNQELDFAIANLPDNAYNGHAVKASALAEKARVALFQNDWVTAANLTNQIIIGGKFSISPDYKGLFITSTQQNNPEIIFSTKYLGPNDVNNFDLYLGKYAALAPYQNLVDEYETTNGKMITDPTSGYNSAHPYVNRDPRLGYSIQVPGDDFINPNGSVFQHSDLLLTGYAPKKYVDLSHLPFSNGQLSDQNVIHTRYADVLLMYAEAKNEASGPDASIYQALNQIRSRPTVNLPPVNQAVYSTQSTLRDFIRHERRVELALEGFRYYDLKRWNIMEQKLSQMKNPGGVQLKFGEINNVLPFPLSEITANPQLKQNQGYQ
jgi:hypothetical protein